MAAEADVPQALDATVTFDIAVAVGAAVDGGTGAGHLAVVARVVGWTVAAVTAPVHGCNTPRSVRP